MKSLRLNLFFITTVWLVQSLALVHHVVHPFHAALPTTIVGSSPVTDTSLETPQHLVSDHLSHSDSHGVDDAASVWLCDLYAAAQIVAVNNVSSERMFSVGQENAFHTDFIVFFPISNVYSRYWQRAPPIDFV